MQKYQAENTLATSEVPSTPATPSFSWDNLSTDSGLSDMMDTFTAEPSIMTVDQEYDLYIVALKAKMNGDLFGYWTVGCNHILLDILYC